MLASSIIMHILSSPKISSIIMHILSSTKIQWNQDGMLFATTLASSGSD